MNIYELIRGRRHYVAEDRVRSYLYQLMKSLDHMHRNGIFHRCGTPAGFLEVSSKILWNVSAAEWLPAIDR
jgi:renal tumor antigen